MALKQLETSHLRHATLRLLGEEGEDERLGVCGPADGRGATSSGLGNGSFDAVVLHFPWVFTRFRRLFGPFEAFFGGFFEVLFSFSLAFLRFLIGFEWLGAGGGEAVEGAPGGERGGGRRYTHIYIYSISYSNG